MKRTLLPLFILPTLALHGQTTLLEESFDAYTEGSGMVANDPTNWAVWPGGEDQVVSTAFAQSGTNSLACISTSAGNGGPGDLLLLLGDRTTGIYDLGWSMYIPADRGGYFNLQHAEDVGSSGSFGLEAVFAGGTVTATAGGSEATGEYVPGEWTDILINVDIDNGGAALFVNGTAITTWDFALDTDGGDVTPQLGAIDFYSYGDGTALGEYYVDDINYVQTSAGGIGLAENAPGHMHIFPNPAQDGVNVLLKKPLGEKASIRLVDVTGKQVANPVVLSSRSVRFAVDGLPAGVYFVRVEDGSLPFIGRVTKL